VEESGNEGDWQGEQRSDEEPQSRGKTTVGTALEAQTQKGEQQQGSCQEQCPRVDGRLYGSDLAIRSPHASGQESEVAGK